MTAPRKFRIMGALLLAIGLLAAACGGSDQTVVQKSDYQKIETKAQARHAYLPRNDVEFSNYNRAQELYDDPSTILWCTTTWPNASAPLVTMPVAGKLTSSSVSYFPNSVVKEGYYDSGVFSYNPELRSVDGMFHGSPPPYRYGFTPGGQYVDLFNMPAVCTTALTKFQRQNTKVSVTTDPGVIGAQRQAEAALKAGLQKQADGTLRPSVAAQAKAYKILAAAVGK